MKRTLLLILPLTTAFKSTNIQTLPSRPNGPQNISVRKGSNCIALNLSDDKRFVASPTPNTEIVVSEENDTPTKAATNTVNERLMQEIQSQTETQKYGKSDLFAEFRSKKTEEERRQSIEEARDLNGVNPLVCIGGAAFAWMCAGGLWLFTTYLGVMFASHPMDTDVYFIQRTVGVFRNVVMGLSSLASGFFGVVGVGIFLLGLRVAYGVMVGELDPTPIRKKGEMEFEMPDVWGLMTGSGKRRGKRNDDLFGL
jgi:hypothetical protein